jgi:serine/threonine protein kinase
MIFKFVMQFIGASVEPSMMLIMELMEGGSLQKNLKSIYPITLRLEQCLSYALDISQAMEYLHANGIIHRDLKPGNLFFLKFLVKYIYGFSILIKTKFILELLVLLFTSLGSFLTILWFLYFWVRFMSSLYFFVTNF